MYNCITILLGAMFHPDMNPLSSSPYGGIKSKQKDTKSVSHGNAPTKIPSRSLATVSFTGWEKRVSPVFCSKGFLIKNERTIIVKMVLFDFQEITVDTLDGSEIRLTSTGW